jgi:hypothetical protein
MLAPDSGPQPDSHAVDAGQACVEESILLARVGVGNEARGCGVNGLQRARCGEVVGTILEPHNQASSRSVEDDATTIAVVGELEGCWFQVDAGATQHYEKLGDEVEVDSTRRSESRSGGQGRPAVVLRRVGDVSRRLLTTKYRSTKTKANPIIGKPIYITFLHVVADRC